MKKWNTVLNFALAAFSAFNGLAAFCRRGENRGRSMLRGILWLAGAALWGANGLRLLTDREPLIALEVKVGGEEGDE